MIEKGKILITGSNGLLGQAVSSVFSRESDFRLLLTSFEDKPFLDVKSEYRKLDITNKEDVKRIASEFKPDVIINCAAFTDVDRCESEREACWKLNVDAVKNLIIASRINNSKIIHISTDYIFDGKNGPYDELHTPNPVSFYGRSKLAGENALTLSGVDYAILRTIVLYGFGKMVKPNFALWLIDKLKNNEPVNIVTDQTGNATISDDLAYAILKVTENDFKGVYNIAGKDIISRYDFAMNVCEVFGFNKALVHPILTSDLNQPAPRPLKSGLITLKAESELGINFMDSKEGLQVLKYQLGE
ncbi:MAG TPA: dTDP-4-dehydrorhamnose reductase [Ignavibacteria bacterium]|nr:dTDP-4-dehydrorhamnose reductase [Ignavibacteria bacterium]